MKRSFIKRTGLGKRKLLAASLALAALIGCSKPEENELGIPTERNAGGPQMTLLQDRYLVILKTGNSKRDIESAIDKLQKHLTQNNLPELVIDPADILHGAVNGFVCDLSPDQASFLKLKDEVSSIEQDMVMSLNASQIMEIQAKPGPAPSATFNDTIINNEFLSYGVRRIGAYDDDIDGTGKTAWIIDSGIFSGHPDLNVDTTRDASFLRSTDGEDYASPEDKLGHGTHVAGVIGAIKGNGGGSMIGAAPNASLVSLRVVNASGFYRFSSLLLAVNYAYEHAQPGDAVNISLTAASNKTLDNAVKQLGAKGVFVAMASGNTSNNCNTLSPQRVNATNVYTVSAMDKTNTFLPVSNFGSPVDFALPGQRIRTTTMVGNGYAFSSGTDIAAPLMTGLLLITNGVISTDGFVLNDPDNKPDPIAHK